MRLLQISQYSVLLVAFYNSAFAAPVKTAADEGVAKSTFRLGQIVMAKPHDFIRKPDSNEGGSTKRGGGRVSHPVVITKLPSDQDHDQIHRIFPVTNNKNPLNDGRPMEDVTHFTPPGHTLKGYGSLKYERIKGEHITMESEHADIPPQYLTKIKQAMRPYNNWKPGAPVDPTHVHGPETKLASGSGSHQPPVHPHASATLSTGSSNAGGLTRSPHRSSTLPAMGSLGHHLGSASSSSAGGLHSGRYWAHQVAGSSRLGESSTTTHLASEGHIDPQLAPSFSSHPHAISKPSRANTMPDHDNPITVIRPSQSSGNARGRGSSRGRGNSRARGSSRARGTSRGGHSSTSRGRTPQHSRPSSPRHDSPPRDAKRRKSDKGK